MFLSISFTCEGPDGGLCLSQTQLHVQGEWESGWVCSSNPINQSPWGNENILWIPTQSEHLGFYHLKKSRKKPRDSRSSSCNYYYCIIMIIIKILKCQCTTLKHHIPLFSVSVIWQKNNLYSVEWERCKKRLINEPGLTLKNTHSQRQTCDLWLQLRPETGSDLSSTSRRRHLSEQLQLKHDHF